MARSKLRRYAIGALTFAGAIAIGLVFQYGDAFASKVDHERTVTASAQTAAVSDLGFSSSNVRTAVPQGFNLPEMPNIERSPFAIDIVPSELTAPEIILPTGIEPFQQSELELPISDIVLTSLNILELESPTEALSQVVDCEMTSSAESVSMAIVKMSIDVPCRPNETFTVHHHGMTFDFSTDDHGRAAIDIPALSENAVFLVSFEDGKTLMSEANVSDIGEYDRAVLLWTGTAGVQLHAREFGAAFGGIGHVWREDMGQFEGAITDVNGMLVALGRDSQFAEVYTFPMAHGLHTGNVELSVEAEVTFDNCGKDVYAQTMQFAQGAPLNEIDLAMKMPDCDAVGEFIVLKNVYEDLTLAQR